LATDLECNSATSLERPWLLKTEDGVNIICDIFVSIVAEISIALRKEQIRTIAFNPV
jgi:hypothetical protein